MTDPTGSVFATVRNRTRRIRGCLNRKTALVMVYRLMMAAKANGRHLSGSEHRAAVIEGIEFRDGIRQMKDAA